MKPQNNEVAGDYPPTLPEEEAITQQTPEEDASEIPPEPPGQDEEGGVPEEQEMPEEEAAELIAEAPAEGDNIAQLTKDISDLKQMMGMVIKGLGDTNNKITQMHNMVIPEEEPERSPEEQAHEKITEDWGPDFANHLRTIASHHANEHASKHGIKLAELMSELLGEHHNRLSSLESGKGKGLASSSIGDLAKANADKTKPKGITIRKEEMNIMPNRNRTAGEGADISNAEDEYIKAVDEHAKKNNKESEAKMIAAEKKLKGRR